MPVFAKTVSSAFHYIFVVPATFLFLLYKYPLPENLKTSYPLLFAFLFIIFPLMVIFIAVKVGAVSDFESTNREERYILNIVGTLSCLLFLILTNRLDIPQVYKLNALYYFIYGCVFGSITFFWKISYHMGVMGWLSALIITIYGLNFVTLLPLFSITVLTGWSRIYLKKHDLAQVVAGFGLSFLIYEILKIVTNFS
jgi:membrane-associated phospholipid phosphatase